MVVAKVALAKAYRDAVFKVVPKALCKPITLAAYQVINKELVTLDQRRDRAKAWIKQIRVDDKRVFALLNVCGWADVTDEHLIVLTGLKTAINDGDDTIDSAFPMTVVAPKISKKGRDELFPTGNKTPADKLAELKSKLSGDVTEAGLIAYIHAKKLADDSLATLDEVQKMKPSAIESLLAAWVDVEKSFKTPKSQ